MEIEPIKTESSPKKSRLGTVGFWSWATLACLILLFVTLVGGTFIIQKHKNKIADQADEIADLNNQISALERGAYEARKSDLLVQALFKRNESTTIDPYQVICADTIPHTDRGYGVFRVKDSPSVFLADFVSREGVKDDGWWLQDIQQFDPRK